MGINYDQTARFKLGSGCHFLKINLNAKLVEKEVTKIHKKKKTL